MTQYIEDSYQNAAAALSSPVSFYLANYSPQQFSTGEVDQCLSKEELERLDKENRLTPEEQRKLKDILKEIENL